MMITQTNNPDRDLLAVFANRPFRKSSASGSEAQSDCVYLPTDGTLNAVADSKTGAVLAVPVAGLLRHLQAG